MIIGIIGPLFSSTKIKDCLKEIDPKMEIKIYIREKVEAIIKYKFIVAFPNRCISWEKSYKWMSTNP